MREQAALANLPVEIGVFGEVVVTDAQVGPDLDKLAADAKAAGEPVADYVRQSIVDPNAVIAKGYQPNVMPPTFGDTLKPDELDALVAYLSGKGAS